MLSSFHLKCLFTFYFGSSNTFVLVLWCFFSYSVYYFSMWNRRTVLLLSGMWWMLCSKSMCNGFGRNLNENCVWDVIEFIDVKIMPTLNQKTKKKLLLSKHYCLCICKLVVDVIYSIEFALKTKEKARLLNFDYTNF